MSWQPFDPSPTSRTPGTTVVAAHDGHGIARLDVMTTSYVHAPTDGGQHVSRAVHEARMCRAHHVEFALNASTPTCGLIVEALHTQCGDDVESIQMRRAGSSVMVSLELRPLADPEPEPVAVAELPARAGRPRAVLASH